MTQDQINYSIDLENEKAMEEYTKEQIEVWKQKAKKWDGMKAEIDKYYCNKEGEYDEDNPVKEGNLIDIGEVAASWTGWL